LDQGWIVDLELGVVSSNARSDIGRVQMTESTCSGAIATEEFLHQINDRPVMIVYQEPSGIGNQKPAHRLSLSQNERSAVILFDENIFRMLATPVDKLLRHEQTGSYQFVS
jgi:hypothetical protein